MKNGKTNDFINIMYAKFESFIMEIRKFDNCGIKRICTNVPIGRSEHERVRTPYSNILKRDRLIQNIDKR